MTLINQNRKVISQLIKEQLNINKDVFFRVTTRSMEPFIRIGDYVVANKVNPETLLPGDIIIFEKGENFCTHRFIQRIESNNTINYITKGDKLIGFDFPFPGNKIFGKVVAIERNKKRVDLTNLNYIILNRTLAKIFKIQYIIYRLGKSIIKSLRTRLK